MLDVKKLPGGVMEHQVSPEDLKLINALAKTRLEAGDVYTFALRLCDNEVDRDFERFDSAALEALSKLFVGKSGIFDHSWSAQGQTARLYRTEICQESGVTLTGEGCRYLKGYAYMLRSEKNRDLIEEIEAGIKKEVSIGCSVARSVCSVCGREHCSHQKGREYDGKLCYFTLQEPQDAYEWSFVAVPAQRKAGVIKTYSREANGTLHRLATEKGIGLAELEQLEQEAQLGRAYMKSLRRELVRLAGLADEALDLQVFGGAVEKLEERELLELTKVYRQRVDTIFPAKPQLHSAGTAVSAEEDGAFLI